MTMCNTAWFTMEKNHDNHYPIKNH